MTKEELNYLYFFAVCRYLEDYKQQPDSSLFQLYDDGYLTYFTRWDYPVPIAPHQILLKYKLKDILIAKHKYKGMMLKQQFDVMYNHKLNQTRIFLNGKWVLLIA